MGGKNAKKSEVLAKTQKIFQKTQKNTFFCLTLVCEINYDNHVGEKKFLIDQLK